MTVCLTHHALARYRERVADLSDGGIRAAVDTPALQCAIDFGAPYLRLPGGQRLVLDGATILTVLPKECASWRLDRRIAR